MRRFEPHDLAEVNGWYVAHGLCPLSEDVLPATGLIVSGVACAFLYWTDAPGLALLEGLVTNPAARLSARREAVAAILASLAVHARENGVRIVVGFTEKHGVARVLERIGFESCGSYRMLKLEG